MKRTVDRLTALKERARDGAGQLVVGALLVTEMIEALREAEDLAGLIVFGVHNVSTGEASPAARGSIEKDAERFLATMNRIEGYESPWTHDRHRATGER